MIELKIKRHTYTITHEDKFMDNGACVQLLTQGVDVYDKRGFRRSPNPVLSKVAQKIINKYKRKPCVDYHNAMSSSTKNSSVNVFSLVFE